MATCSKYEEGYDDNRFEIVVGEEFHCSICLLVLKDPVMCKNQHYYCSSCIKEYLANVESCPTCREHLSVDTLIQVPRIVTDYLSKLNIHCDFYPRGCREVIQLSNLKRHVASCGFSPVQCSNDGCNVLVNKRDKLHHEAELCDFRKSKCHDCGELKKEVKEMKDDMLHRQDQMKDEMKEMKNGIKAIKDGMNEMIDQVIVRQVQLENKMANEIKEEIKNQMRNEMKEMREEMKKEMKEMKEEMKDEMKEMVMNAMRDAMAGKKNLEVKMKISKQSSQATCSTSERENIIVTGGFHEEGDKTVKNKSTEFFNWTDQIWTLSNSAMFEGRSSTCSFLYQGQMVVAGGFDDGGNTTNEMKCLNVADPAATWKDFAVDLPVKCFDHQVISYNDRLLMSGGCVQHNGKRTTRSDVVSEVQLVPPYSSKMLTRLPQPRSNHGMELFDNKLFILGGFGDEQITNSVVQYDLIKNKCKVMPPLPYAVQNMATVLWRNNVLVIGGEDERYITLNTVFMYDVITGRSQMLPCMERKRCGCTAVVTGNVVVVMGGRDENFKDLKSVECFDLQRQVWQDLPDMLEPRAFATAVVKPNR